MIGNIYTLRCPKSGDVFYVGATTRPLKSRLSGHMTESRTTNHSVLRYIRENEIIPIIELVEECHYEEDQEFKMNENYWIDQFRQWGFPLKNVINNKSAKRNAKREFKRPETESVKISKPLLNILRNYKDISHVMVGRFIEFAIEEKLRSLPDEMQIKIGLEAKE